MCVRGNNNNNNNNNNNKTHTHKHINETLITQSIQSDLWSSRRVTLHRNYMNIWIIWKQQH